MIEDTDYEATKSEVVDLEEEDAFEEDSMEADFEASLVTKGGKHPHHFVAEQRDVPFHVEHKELGYNIQHHTATLYPPHVAKDLGARPGSVVIKT